MYQSWYHKGAGKSLDHLSGMPVTAGGWREGEEREKIRKKNIAFIWKGYQCDSPMIITSYLSLLNTLIWIVLFRVAHVNPNSMPLDLPLNEYSMDSKLSPSVYRVNNSAIPVSGHHKKTVLRCPCNALNSQCSVFLCNLKLFEDRTRVGFCLFLHPLLLSAHKEHYQNTIIVPKALGISILPVFPLLHT